MLEKLAGLRVNFLIVFLGAPLIILTIKAVSLLLPPKYYFSFSKLVAGSSEPFIVDPPGITAKKLCEVMVRAAIPRSAFRDPIRTCNRDYELPFSPREIDRIYGIALGHDGEIRKALRDEAAKMQIKVLTEAEIRELAAKEETVVEIINAIVAYYNNEIGRMRGAYDSEKIDSLYELPEENTKAQSPEDLDSKLAVTESLIAQILKAHEGFLAELAPKKVAEKIAPIRKSILDEMIRKAEGGDIGTRVSGYYDSQISDSVRSVITDGFAKFNLNSRRLVFEEINSFSWTNYVLSVLVRLTPVFLFGLICGIVFGRAENFSASLAGGMAAFLLCWPLMLMWERLVQSSWTDKKWLFFGFYTVYMVSFFLTARCGSIIGGRLRENLPTPEGRPSSNVTWRDIAINTAGAVAINAVVYAWNLYLPLSSAAAQ